LTQCGLSIIPHLFKLTDVLFKVIDFNRGFINFLLDQHKHKDNRAKSTGHYIQECQTGTFGFFTSVGHLQLANASQQVFVAIALGIDDLTILHALQLMEQKHQKDTDQ